MPRKELPFLFNYVRLTMQGVPHPCPWIAGIDSSIPEKEWTVADGWTDG